MNTIPLLKNTLEKIRQNSSQYFRWVIFLTFLGHGLVNLGLSPSYDFHLRIASSLFSESVSPELMLQCVAAIDLLLAIIVLFGVKPRISIPIAVTYLLLVAAIVWYYYYQQSGSIFGFAEIMRRLPWVFFLVFIYTARKNKSPFTLLRIGLSFAFLAHGTASLGILGINEGHIELATEIVPENWVRDFVFYTGASDTIIGIFLMLGIASRVTTYVGTCWLFLVVGLSFSFAIPDGLFRLGFLLSGLYVAIDPRCHTLTIGSIISASKK